LPSECTYYSDVASYLYGKPIRKGWSFFSIKRNISLLLISCIDNPCHNEAIGKLFYQKADAERWIIEEGALMLTGQFTQTQTQDLKLADLMQAYKENHPSQNMRGAGAQAYFSINERSRPGVHSLRRYRLTSCLIF